VDKMKEKEKLIIDVAMKLFSEKGFDATSIQEIVDEAGISKGAFYLYFKSKEALLIEIFKYFYHKRKKKIEEICKRNLSPREKFMEYLVCNYTEISKYKEFLIMQTREQAIPINESIAKLIHKMYVETKQFYKLSLMDIYGKRIEPFIGDLIIILHGIFHSYMHWTLFQKKKIDYYKLATFILQRMDDLVKGLLKSGEEAIIPFEELEQGPLHISQLTKKLHKKDLLRQIRKIKKQHSHSSDLYITLDVLEEEISNEKPRIPVIQGMLSNLKDIEDTLPLQMQIKKYFHLKEK
jgi:AcrR family transcriptional regulator